MAENAPNSSVSQALVALLKSFHKIFNDIIHVAKLEARLAGKSLAVLVVLLLFALFLLVGVWILSLGLLVWGLEQFGLSLWVSLLSGIGLNIVLLGIIALVAIKLGGNLGFSATRRQLQAQQTLPQEVEHEFKG